MVHTISVVVEAFLSGTVETIVESVEKVGGIGCLKRQDLSRKTIQDGQFPRLHFERRRETVSKKARPALPVILEFQLWIHRIIDGKGSIHDEAIEMPLALRDHIRQRPETGGLTFESDTLERNRFV